MDQDKATESPAASCIGVRIRDAGCVCSYGAGRLDLQSGDQVVVETEHGNMLGTAIAFPEPARPRPVQMPLQRIIKKADTSDLEKDDRNRTREREALRICWHRIGERGLQMRLIKAEYALDGGKIVFYFSAEGRVDFRDLVRDLACTLHARIDMKQVGTRDAAKLVGAIGPCGRPLCCSSFLPAPGGVSVKMAKAQGLALNPSKLAGMCGRLKCCLRYEYETYLAMRRALPAVGAAVMSVKGNGVVARQHLLKEAVTIRCEGGVETEVTLEDLVGKTAQ